MCKNVLVFAIFIQVYKNNEILFSSYTQVGILILVILLVAQVI